MKKIIIFVSEESQIDYLCRMVKLLLPGCEISLLLDDSEDALFIILDNKSAFESLSIEQRNKAIVYSRDTNFVSKAVADSYTVILRSYDFYDSFHKILSKHKII